MLNLLNLHRVTRRGAAQDRLESVRGTVDFVRQEPLPPPRRRRPGPRRRPVRAALHRAVPAPLRISAAGVFLRMKIQEACRLLVNGATPVREISDGLGFEDPYYFSRFFKKITRLAPAHYREAKRLR
ncbi:MAG: helix-turn-helix domain-containing protein [Kiritimatiellia bacterium]